MYMRILVNKAGTVCNCHCSIHYYDAQFIHTVCIRTSDCVSPTGAMVRKATSPHSRAIQKLRWTKWTTLV